MEHAVAENVYAGNAMSRRLFFQYGVLLPTSPFGHVDQSIGKNTAAGAIGLIEPNVIIKKSIEERTETFEKEYADLGRIARLQNKTKESMEYYKMAWEENKENPYNYYQVCVLADEYYKDPQTRLQYFERLLDMYPDLPPFLKERVLKRVSEIKEGIHYAGN